MSMSLEQHFSAKVQLLIRSPVHEVFDAFVMPQTIERFWLKKAGGRLAKDATVHNLHPQRSREFQ